MPIQAEKFIDRVNSELSKTVNPTIASLKITTLYPDDKLAERLEITDKYFRLLKLNGRDGSNGEAFKRVEQLQFNTVMPFPGDTTPLTHDFLCLSRKLHDSDALESLARIVVSALEQAPTGGESIQLRYLLATIKLRLASQQLAGTSLLYEAHDLLNDLSAMPLTPMWNTIVRNGLMGTEFYKLEVESGQVPTEVCTKFYERYAELYSIGYYKQVLILNMLKMASLSNDMAKCAEMLALYENDLGVGVQMMAFIVAHDRDLGFFRDNIGDILFKYQNHANTGGVK